MESPDSESDMDLPSQELKERVETPEIERTSRMRLLESSRGSARVDINAVQCLGIVKRKGARAGGPPVQSRKDDLKKGHAVNTKLGPCISSHVVLGAGTAISETDTQEAGTLSSRTCCLVQQPTFDHRVQVFDIDGANRQSWGYPSGQEHVSAES